VTDDCVVCVVFYEHGNEPLGSVSVGKFLYRLVECQLVNKDSVPLGLYYSRHTALYTIAVSCEGILASKNR
jgi:hypothetical protein